MERDDKGMWVEVIGRVIPASTNSADAVVAIDAEKFGDDDIYDYTTYLVEDAGLGMEIRDMRDETIIAGGYLQELPSGDPILRISRFERW